MEGRNRETGRRPHSHPSSSFPNARGRGRGRGRGRFFSSKPIPNPAISDHLPSLDGRDVDEKESAAEAASPKFSPLIGTCPDMCPARERVQRERLRDLSVFERLNGNPGRTSRSLAVKKFCRTISSMHVQATDIRPLPVLQDTLEYLLKLLESSEHPFDIVHDFVFDRTRSIRQDLCMQNIIHDQAIHMYEEMVRFHVLSNRKLPRCGGNPNVSSLHYLNMEQLMKSLKSLYELYDINRRSNSTNKNEAEFYSFYVLLHLGPNSHSTGESLCFWFQRLASPIIKSNEMCFARSVLRYFRVRTWAISYINNCGYKLHPYPLARLSEVLMMKESEVESLCNTCGLETKVDEAGIRILPTKQTGFCFPKRGFQNYSFPGLK